MKKIFFAFTAVIIMLFCTSCSESVKIPEVRVCVEDNAAVSVGDAEYKCRISYVNDTTSSVEIFSPDSLKNMTFRKTADGLSVSLGTLVCKSEDFYFSDGCLFVQIINALSAIKQDNVKFISKQNDMYMFSLKSEPVCKFFTDGDGYITSLSGKDIKIKFER